MRISSRSHAGEGSFAKNHPEIARKYCQILKKYGPRSAEVKHAVLAISTVAGESEILRALDAILQPSGVRNRVECGGFFADGGDGNPGVRF